MKELKRNIKLDTEHGGDTPCILYGGRYATGRALALELTTNVPGREWQEPLARVSTNLPDHVLLPGEFFCKDWSENSGMCDWLEENGIAKRTGKAAIAGYVLAEVMLLAPELLAKLDAP